MGFFLGQIKGGFVPIVCEVYKKDFLGGRFDKFPMPACRLTVTFAAVRKI
nr:MAG TPA: hypothetical protein [Caudoviricetes sp.]